MRLASRYGVMIPSIIIAVTVRSVRCAPGAAKGVTMSVARDIENYFAALERLKRQPARQSVRTETLPFVTISRQSGAGGHTLAEALLAAMAGESDRELFDGWQIFDRAHFEEMEQREGEGELRTLLGEEYHTQIGEFLLGLFGRQPPQDALLLRQSRLIRSVAVLGRAIIVGYGASQACKGLRSGLHLRLVAPEPWRVKRLAAQTGLDEARARQEGQRRDQARARLLKQHYRVDIDDPLQYDAICNGERLDRDTLAAAVIAAIKQRASVLR